MLISRLRRVAMLISRLRRDEAGSGMVIGVAIIFPFLMLVIVSLQMLNESSRIGQALQATANRAAHTASLCCYATGGPDGAVAVAEASLAAAESANTSNRVFCNNDFVGDSQTLFIGVDGNDVAMDPDNAVPPGGTVYVFLKCRIPPQNLGGFGFPGLNVERKFVGTATVDPYRLRQGA